MIVLSAHRKVIINNHFLKDPFMEHSSHVDAVLIHLQIWENLRNSVLLFCEACNGAEKIAIANSALQNITRSNGIADKTRVLHYFAHPLPRDLLYISTNSERLLFGGKIGISPHFVGFSIFFYNGLVVRLHDALENEFLKGFMMHIEVVHDVVKVIAFFATLTSNNFAIYNGFVSADVCL